MPIRLFSHTHNAQLAPCHISATNALNDLNDLNAPQISDAQKIVELLRQKGARHTWRTDSLPEAQPEKGQATSSGMATYSANSGDSNDSGGLQFCTGAAFEAPKYVTRDVPARKGMEDIGDAVSSARDQIALLLGSSANAPSVLGAAMEGSNTGTSVAAVSAPSKNAPKSSGGKQYATYTG